jgi:hypothetical protein
MFEIDMLYLYVFVCLLISSIKMPSLIQLVQIGTKQSAPNFFSTPFCENRYQIIAVLTERCHYFCKFIPVFSKDREILVDFSVLHKTFTAFAYRIRAPPSEV